MTGGARRTRVVCTIGPSTREVAGLSALLEAGMDVARLNLSHGNHTEHGEVISRLRELSAQRNMAPAILLDLQGLKIRVGQLRGGELTLAVGQQVRVTAGDQEGDATRIPIDYPCLAQDAQPGDTILMDDGLLMLRVDAIDGEELLATVVHGGQLKSRKGVNLPGVQTSISAITDKDASDIIFAASQQIDYVALSFVRSAADVEALRTQLQAAGSEAAVVAKIEKPEAVDALDEIINAADAIMVARGDLGIEMDSERVPLVQKRIIDRCRRASKPVITATQMLESMMQNPRPTRAESSDVANAVLDGTDAVMLSGESAAGRYPIEAVKALSRICQRVEQEASGIYQNLGYLPPQRDDKRLIESLSHACVSMAREVGARVIATITHSGKTAKRIAKYRPDVPIIAFTESDAVMRQLQLVWGVTPVKVEQLFDTDRSVRLMEDSLLAAGLVTSGDLVVLATGIPMAERGRTNMVTISRIS